MPTNRYIRSDIRSEQLLYEDLTIEALAMYGQEIYYLPRTIVDEDRILGEDVPSTFSSNYKIEMYIENTDGFDGEGDLFTKFGIQIKDQATFIVSRRRWKQYVGNIANDVANIRPREGDLIYLPMTKKLFEIQMVEHEQPFYQLQNLPVYKMQCELFTYTEEDLDTGIDVIDNIAARQAYTYTLTLDTNTVDFELNELVTQTMSSGRVLTAEVSNWNPSLNELSLINIQSDTGGYIEFDTTQPIKDTANIVSITEGHTDFATDNNQQFSNEAVDFLDFSESNPFGDPE